LNQIPIESHCIETLFYDIIFFSSVFSGPDHWHLDYKHCGGVKQSPINVQTDEVIVDDNYLSPIIFSGYDTVSDVNYTLGNNGHTGIMGYSLLV